MKMKNAEDRSDYYVWYVLDKIMEKRLPDEKSEISYYLNLNILRNNPISFLDERNALMYLLENKVIGQIEETGLAEIGKKGNSKYIVEEIYNLRIKRKFFEFYDKYNIKVNPSTTESVIKSWNRSIQRLIESINGTQGKKLIEMLSNEDVTSKQIVSGTKTKAVYKLILNINKVIKNLNFKITKTNNRGIDGLYKYHLEIS